MYSLPPGTQRPVSSLNALTGGSPGAAGLGTREANRRYTAFETSFGRRDVLPGASIGTGKLNATKGGRGFTYSDRGS